MKITVYTIKDCAFSKQEREYLNANKLSFEEKDLEANKDFLTEMLAISNNFAGTPVTRVEKDDGSIAVLKGFTKEEFDTTFGFAQASTPATSPAINPAPVINDTPIPPVIETPPAPPTPAPIPVDQPPVIPPNLSADSSSVGLPKEEAPAKVDPLQSVMDDLQAKAGPTIADSTVPPSGAPSIPDFPTELKTTV